MINNVTIVGRLTKDPEVRDLTNSTVASFTLAVQRNKDDVDFIPCEVWNKTADSVRKFVTKGSLIGVEGSIRVDNYETDEGERRTFTKVVGRKVDFILLKSTNEAPEDRGPDQFMTDAELAARQ